MHGNTLVDGHVTGVHDHRHAAVDRQVILCRINILRANDRQLDRHCDGINGKVASRSKLCTAGTLEIILFNIARLKIEHESRRISQERNSTILDANTANVDRHVRIFYGTCTQSQRNLNILHIILGHGEDTFSVINQACSCATATPILQLEAFINRSSTQCFHTASTSNITPCRQRCSTVQGNLAAPLHHNETNTARRMAIVAHLGRLLTIHAQIAHNRQVCTISHGKRTRGSRL